MRAICFPRSSATLLQRTFNPAFVESAMSFFNACPADESIPSITSQSMITTRRRWYSGAPFWSASLRPMTCADTAPTVPKKM